MATDSAANAPAMDASISSLNSADNDASATSSANIDSQNPKWASTTTSVAGSPLPSRDPSPTRPRARSTKQPARPSASPHQPRKNGGHDASPSPSRSRTSIPTPSAAAKGQLSAATTPPLPPPQRTSDLPLRAPAPLKPSHLADCKDAPRWPVSPRLKSPPPTLTKPLNPPARKMESEPPSINVQRATPSPQVETSSQNTSDSDPDESQAASGTKTPARSGSSALETVHEASQPNTPQPGVDAAIEKLTESVSADSQSDTKSQAPAQKNCATKNTASGPNSESSSDSGSVKADPRRNPNSTGPPPSLHSRQSSSALKFGARGQQTSGESSSRNMTVETEEVTNMSKLSLAPTPGTQGTNGTLRTKPSTETIKPKKEKKKHPRKPASVASGTGEKPRLLSTAHLRHSRSIRSMSPTSCRSPIMTSGQGSLMVDGDIVMANPRQLVQLSEPVRLSSRTASITSHVTNLLTKSPRSASSKADIFEAKVASAVEEANSSDSDETFVYDSNPPDAGDRPRRFHSRTPSATSMASQADRNGLRSIHGVIENGPTNLPAKKNLKFSNTYSTHSAESPNPEDDGSGTGRSNNGSGRGTGRHLHHHSRWGRQNGGNHLSLFDNESPFPSASTTARSKLSGTNSGRSSNPPSPRFPPNRSWINNARRHQHQAPQSYDMDDTTTGADDERTPLLVSGTVRSPRAMRSRRSPLNRNLEAQSYQRRPSFLNRFASCLVLTVMVLLVIISAIGFMFATSQPLSDIELMEIDNIITSEQELMMDIAVRAHNPNVVVVTIDSADLEVFARSPHAGTDSEWWRHPQDALGHRQGRHTNMVDDDAPKDDSQPNMRLGNILKFDSPLTYEGAFFQSGISTATGSLRLVRPGNDTDGGSERWERIMADEFTLTIKGVLKYTLPLSQRIRSVSISGKTSVKPDSTDGPPTKGNSSDVGILARRSR